MFLQFLKFQHNSEVTSKTRCRTHTHTNTHQSSYYNIYILKYQKTQ